MGESGKFSCDTGQNPPTPGDKKMNGQHLRCQQNIENNNDQVFPISVSLSLFLPVIPLV